MSGQRGAHGRMRRAGRRPAQPLFRASFTDSRWVNKSGDPKVAAKALEESASRINERCSRNKPYTGLGAGKMIFVNFGFALCWTKISRRGGKRKRANAPLPP